MDKIPLIFKNSCPNCGGEIDFKRLIQGLPCKKCLEDTNLQTLKDGKYKEFLNFLKQVDNWKDFFVQKTTLEPWSLQVAWTKRLLQKTSFSILVPTGVGKTTWGIVSALYLQKQSKKTLLVFPSNALLLQVLEKFEKLGFRPLYYASKLKNKEKQQNKEKIKNNDFDILLLTTAFISRNFEILEDKRFDFIFVDDVDSVLKSSASLDKILRLVGFDDKDFDLAKNILQLETQLAKNSNDLNLLKKYSKLKNKLVQVKSKINTTLVVSSATARPKGTKVKLLKPLLGFEVGTLSVKLRNVEDLYVENCNEKILLKLLGLFPNGIFLFVSEDYGKDKVNELKEILLQQGINTETYENLSEGVLNNFIDGKIQVLIGIASYRNPLARGIDLPQIAKYAIFYGVPKMIFKLSDSWSPALAYSLLNLFAKANFVDEKFLKESISFVKNILKHNKFYLDYHQQLQEKLNQITDYLKNLLSKQEIKNYLQEQENLPFDGEKFIIADVNGYIQASGRVSRLYPGGLTKGISIVLKDNNKAFNNLKLRLKYYFDDLEFEKLDLS